MSISTAAVSYDVRIDHRRRDVVSHAFTNRASIWLVDLDHIPTLPRGLRWLCRFSSRDHLGDDDRSLRENLDGWLAAHGVPRPSTVRMLANPRVLGHVFNPLSVFYCYDETGTLSHVVAEVHNTYGGRHSYIVQPDATGHASTEKVFYVSPFHEVDGWYELDVPSPDDTFAVSITLNRAGHAPFRATMRGRRRETASLWSALRTPLVTRAVSFHIRLQGIRLYLKGLRPFPRPEHQPHDPARSQR